MNADPRWCVLYRMTYSDGCVGEYIARSWADTAEKAADLVQRIQRTPGGAVVDFVKVVPWTDAHYERTTAELFAEEPSMTEMTETSPITIAAEAWLDSLPPELLAQLAVILPPLMVSFESPQFVTLINAAFTPEQQKAMVAALDAMVALKTTTP